MAVYNAPEPLALPEITETIETPTSTPNTPYNTISSEISLYCSCVRATQEIYPEIPLQDAIEFKPNGTIENSEMVLLQYKSKTSDGYIYHIAPYKLGTSTIHIYNEGNYDECRKTERDITINDEHIIGFYDYDLWLEILELPKSAQETLRKESHFQHYKSDGSVLIGPTHDYGIAQFTRSTWNWFNELRAKQELPKLYEILDPYQQVQMVSWAWQNNLQNHWYGYTPPTS